MKNEQIVFTKRNTAQLLRSEYKKPSANEVAVKTAFSTISCGTEKVKYYRRCQCQHTYR